MNGKNSYAFISNKIYPSAWIKIRKIQTDNGFGFTKILLDDLSLTILQSPSFTLILLVDRKIVGVYN